MRPGEADGSGFLPLGHAQGAGGVEGHIGRRLPRMQSILEEGASPYWSS